MELKTVILPENASERKEVLSRLLENYDIVSLSEDGNAVTLRLKTKNEDINPMTKLPNLYD